MYTVTLKHAKNPDIPGGYWEGAPTERSAFVAAATLPEAARLCRAYIERNGLGGGNWIGGKVYQGRTQVARVSFNGRIWAMDGTEIKLSMS